MKCRFCGSGIEESWKFCPKCGSIQRDMFRNLDEIVNKMKRE
ncbi:MAG: zinc ribbon domain-containing protein, partial [Nanoarchaeota archaeon]|nr:zinc ribbon domain-containing protein [Nanoarchaeota archaeon]